MTDGHRPVTHPPPPTPLGTIEPSRVPPSPRHGRARRRRRLGLLTGSLLAILALAPLAASDGDESVTVAGASPEAAAASDDPADVEGTVDALLDDGRFEPMSVGEGALTRITTPDTDEETSPAGDGDAATSTTAAAETTRSTEHEHEHDDSPSTTSAPATTAAPATTSPPTTQAPAPEPEPEQSGYAYDDPRSTQVWYDLAGCESGGDWHINTGNGYYGGLQFSLGSWEGVGGTGYPHEHSAEHQIEMGRRLQASQGWGAWPHCSEKLGLR